MKTSEKENFSNVFKGAGQKEALRRNELNHLITQVNTKIKCEQGIQQRHCGVADVILEAMLLTSFWCFYR